MKIKIGFIVIKALLEDMTRSVAKGPANPLLGSIFFPKSWAYTCHMPEQERMCVACGRSGGRWLAGRTKPRWSSSAPRLFHQLSLPSHPLLGTVRWCGLR